MVKKWQKSGSSRKVEVVQEEQWQKSGKKKCHRQKSGSGRKVTVAEKYQWQKSGSSKRKGSGRKRAVAKDWHPIFISFSREQLKRKFIDLCFECQRYSPFFGGFFFLFVSLKWKIKNEIPWTSEWKITQKPPKSS